MSIQVKPMTADELFDLPDDGFRYELVRGELKKMAPPGEEHGLLVAEVTASLSAHVKANNLGRVYAGEVGFRLTADPDTVRASDVAFVSQARLDALAPGTGYRPQAPDLVVKVVSPSDRYDELEAKVLEWLEVGVRMVLVVNPRKRIVTVYRSHHEIQILSESEGDAIDGAEVVPGWRLPLRELFA
jgi:Uma2 family endonuclease